MLSDCALRSVVSGKPELKLTVKMVQKQNGFYALSAPGLGNSANLTNLAQVLMHLICIQEILGFKFGHNIDCPHDLCDFPQSLQTNNPNLGHNQFL
jgi:hypothetical protein